jgi:hypothetical protein
MVCREAAAAAPVDEFSGLSGLSGGEILMSL